MSQTKAQLIDNLVQALNFTGTASAPANGAFLSATNTLALATNSAQRLTIDSSGRLLLGTTTEGFSEGDDLTINSADHGGITIRTPTNKEGNIAFSDTTSGTGEYSGLIRYRHLNDDLGLWTASNLRLLINSSGNVGIGESASIDARLHINSGTDNATLFIESTDGDVNLCMADNAGSCRLLQSAGDLHFRTGGNANAFGTGDSERMVIDSSGNVGIGTTSPSFPSGKGLEIFNSANPRIKLTNTNTGTTATDGTQFYLSSDGTTIIDNKDSQAITFHSNASEKMRIDSSGNVGIGTTSPDRKFQVTEATSNRVVNITTGGSSGAFLAFLDSNTTDDSKCRIGTKGGNHLSLRGDSHSFQDGAGSDKVHIDSSGNVGIGTTSPTTPDGSNAGNSNNGKVFTIYGDSPAINLIHNTSGGSAASDDYSAINFGRNGSSSNPFRAVIGYKQDGDALHINAQGSIKFDVGGNINTSEAMRIDSSGRLLIGQTSGSSPLCVSGTDPVIAELHHSDGGTNDQARISLGALANNPPSNRGVNLIAENNGAGHDFVVACSASHSAGPTERIRVLSNGNLGVGTSAPSHLFHVNGTSRTTALLVNSSGGHNSSRVHIVGHSTGSHTNIRCADSAGNTLMLLRNDGPFFVNAVYSQTTSAGANVNVQSNGNIVRSTSSVRYKKDITDATWGLTEVLKLKPKTFKNNATGEDADKKTYGGFTAEDVHDLGLTEFVEYDKDNQPDALFYGNMVALMAKAIQDLDAKVETLETKVAALEAA